MEALAVLLALAAQAESITKAMKAVGELIENARAQGREVTKEELENLTLADDLAAKALDQAIEDQDSR